MPKLTKKQINEINTKLKNLGEKDKAMRLQILDCIEDNNNSDYVLYSHEKSMSLTLLTTFIAQAFDWRGTKQGYNFWRAKYDDYSIKESSHKTTNGALTEAEVQQLLHELRDTLSMVTEIKNEYKTGAARLWELSDKVDSLSLGHFKDFSLIRKFYLAHKKREQRLIGLITKLKGMK